MASSRRISRASSKAKYMRKRRAGYKGSGRHKTNYHEGRLWRGGVGQCAQGQGVSHLFVRMLQCCLAGRYIRNLLPEVMVKLEPFIVETFVLLGSHALRPIPHSLSWELASGRWRWPVCTRARRIFSFWENFVRLPRWAKCSHARNRDRGGVHNGRGVFPLGDRQWQVMPRPPSRGRIGEHSRPS